MLSSWSLPVVRVVSRAWRDHVVLARRDARHRGEVAADERSASAVPVLAASSTSPWAWRAAALGLRLERRPGTGAHADASPRRCLRCQRRRRLVLGEATSDASAAAVGGSAGDWARVLSPTGVRLRGHLRVCAQDVAFGRAQCGCAHPPAHGGRRFSSPTPRCAPRRRPSKARPAGRPAVARIARRRASSRPTARRSTIRTPGRSRRSRTPRRGRVRSPRSAEKFEQGGKERRRPISRNLLLSFPPCDPLERSSTLRRRPEGRARPRSRAASRRRGGRRACDRPGGAPRTGARPRRPCGRGGPGRTS